MSIIDRYKPPLDYVHVGPYARWHPFIYKHPQDAISATYSAISEILNTISDNLLYGFCIKEYSFDADNNIYVKVGPGTCILNGSLISISTESEMKLNLTPFDDSGRVIVSLIHKTDEHNRKQIPIFRIQYVDSTGTVVERGNWIVKNSSVLIVGVFEFTKTGGVVTEVRDVTKSLIRQPITIQSNTYYVYGNENGFADFVGNAKYLNSIAIPETIPPDGATLIYNALINQYEYSTVGLSTVAEEYSFNFTSPHIVDLDLVPANTTISRITVYVDTPFDDPTANIMVGDAAQDSRLVKPTEVYLGEEGIYEIVSGYTYTSSTQILLTVNPFTSTQGSGRVWLEKVSLS